MQEHQQQNQQKYKRKQHNWKQNSESLQRHQHQANFQKQDNYQPLKNRNDRQTNQLKQERQHQPSQTFQQHNDPPWQNKLNTLPGSQKPYQLGQESQQHNKQPFNQKQETLKHQQNQQPQQQNKQFWQQNKQQQNHQPRQQNSQLQKQNQQQWQQTKQLHEQNQQPRQQKQQVNKLQESSSTSGQFYSFNPPPSHFLYPPPNLSKPRPPQQPVDSHKNSYQNTQNNDTIQSSPLFSNPPPTQQNYMNYQQPPPLPSTSTSEPPWPRVPPPTQLQDQAEINSRHSSVQFNDGRSLHGQNFKQSANDYGLTNQTFNTQYSSALQTSHQPQLSQMTPQTRNLSSSHQPQTGNMLPPHKQQPANMLPPRQQHPENMLPPHQQQPGNMLPPHHQQAGNMLPPHHQQAGNMLPPHQQQPGNMVPPHKQQPGNMLPPHQQQPGNMLPPHQQPPWNMLSSFPQFGGESYVEQTEREKDQQWTNNFISRSGKRSAPKASNVQTIKIPEAKNMIRNYTRLLDDLKLQRDLLIENVEIDAESWKIALQQIADIKEKLQSVSEKITSSEFIRKLVDKLKLRQKKNLSLKKRRQVEKEEKEEYFLKIEKEDERINAEIAKAEKEKLEKLKEKQLQKEIDTTLFEVRKKKKEADKTLEVLRGLRKLRHVRKMSSEQKGIVLPLSSETIFEQRISQMEQFMNRQRAVYTAEEKAMQVMLEEEQEETKEQERKMIQEKMKEKERKQLQIRRKMLFGNEKIEDINLVPFNTFYKQSEFNLDAFLHIRYMWDQCLVEPHTDGASSIPVAWVIPEPPSRRTWKTALNDSFTT